MQHHKRNQKQKGNVRKHPNPISKASLVSLWTRVEKQNKYEQRKVSHMTRRKKTRKARCQGALSKKEKYIKKALRETICDCRQSQRRAVLITPKGIVSPMKLLPYTKHEHGVVGSLLNAKPVAVAVKADGPRSKILAMGAQHNYAVPWDIKPYRILKDLLHMAPLTDKVYGTVIILKMSLNKYNMPFIDDLPLINGPVEYVKQVHLAEGSMNA